MLKAFFVLAGCCLTLLSITNTFAFDRELSHLDSPVLLYRKAVKTAGLESRDQSFCFQTGQSESTGDELDSKRVPASVTKLFTSLAALDRLGPQHRFQTHFYTDGKDVEIQGGADPLFYHENLLILLSQFSRKFGSGTIQEVRFDSRFFFDREVENVEITKKLQRVLNPIHWSAREKRAFDALRPRAKAVGFSIPKGYPRFSVSRIRFEEKFTPSLPFWMGVTSAPLLKSVKHMNVVSENRIARSLFEGLGDADSFNAYLKNSLGFEESGTFIAEGSGGLRNYTNCRDVLKIVQKLTSLASAHGLKASQIFQMAHFDRGTLEDRFTSPQVSGAVLAKTGTLFEGYSTLAGLVGTKRGVVYFAILNQGSPKAIQKMRTLQDQVVESLIAMGGGKKTFEYVAHSFDPLAGIKVRH